MAAYHGYTLHVLVTVYNRNEKQIEHFPVYTTPEDLAGFMVVCLARGHSEVYAEDTSDKTKHCYARQARYAHKGHDFTRQELVANLNKFCG